MNELLSNEIFALACLQRYAEEGDIVDESNGEFAHCPLPERYGDEGYYLTHEDHQWQGLLQSRDIGELCFFAGDAKKWLRECDPMPADYFELWDIYDEFAVEMGKKLMEEKNEEGKSVRAVEMSKKGEARRKEVLSKPVIALAENGEKINFSSIVSCANEFKVNESAVRKWLNKGRYMKIGKAKGWRFLLAQR